MNTSSEQTKSIIHHHLHSFLSGDIPELMTDYTEDTLLITPDKELHGKERIKQFFIDLSIHFPRGKSTINMEKMIVDDDLGYIVWNAITPTIEVNVASDTFVIKDQKIHRQTFIGVITPKH